mmetsp:Transcript_26827/g.39693  ORF Transcript_26827/g.39693 Transcript_26827/m.39693 type:complete len:293 (-) Transcript_26827:314-1192(-)|eukprot:CAMPEP_0195508492 /NCGR_PEP_ID=MMETSP0794_2-20130614/1690_1 /TAXON_ID=515487 /ORGANISM="Stephanopyxis turris, Strain CCMP 815" /LENGTH=292 /DNA_ID=CAMNT_0040635473 /DNA_START=80 /DNA_END=958 /DNA_ORIENTATION=+
MANNGMKLLRPVIFICVAHLMFVQWKKCSSDSSKRVLRTGEELTKISLTDISEPQARNLNVLENYELVSDGYCTDRNGHQFDAFLYTVGSIEPREGCAEKCDSLVSCKGFDVNVIGFCYVYFSDGEAPSVATGSLASTNPDPSGFGEIFSGDDQGVSFSCFKKSVGQTNNEVSFNNYDHVGQGYCRDAQQNKYKYLGFALGPFGTVEDCAKKCDVFQSNQGFTWLLNNFCMCNFDEENLPFDPSNATTLASIPGAACSSGGTGLGRCEIHYADDYEGHDCFRHKNAPGCVTA